MHIVVCAKQIPNPEIASSVFRVNEATKEVIPVAGIAQVMSPFDEQALEAALRVREQVGAAKITLISLGKATTRELSKQALSLGADEAVLLTDPAFDHSDSYTTALALTAAIKKLGAVDLILTGRQAADGDAGVVGCGIAELLNVPAITFAKSITVKDGVASVERVTDGGFETVEAPLPSLVTVSNELGEVRKANLRETMKAARKPTNVWAPADIGIEPEKLGSAGARRSVERLYAPQKESNCEMLDLGSAAANAATLIQRLRDRKVI